MNTEAAVSSDSAEGTFEVSSPLQADFAQGADQALGTTPDESLGGDSATQVSDLEETALGSESVEANFGSETDNGSSTDVQQDQTVIPGIEVEPSAAGDATTESADEQYEQQAEPTTALATEADAPAEEAQVESELSATELATDDAPEQEMTSTLQERSGDAGLVSGSGLLGGSGGGGSSAGTDSTPPSRDGYLTPIFNAASGATQSGTGGGSQAAGAASGREGNGDRDGRAGFASPPSGPTMGSGRSTTQSEVERMIEQNKLDMKMEGSKPPSFDTPKNAHILKSSRGLGL